MPERAPTAFPPGPRGHFLVGSLPEFARDIHGFFTSCVRDYGDFVHFRLTRNEVFLLQRSEDIEAVLLTQHANFIKHTFFWKHVTALFGSSFCWPAIPRRRHGPSAQGLGMTEKDGCYLLSSLRAGRPLPAPVQLSRRHDKSSRCRAFERGTVVAL
jgi:hypothetical protein